MVRRLSVMVISGLEVSAIFVQEFIVQGFPWPVAVRKTVPA